MSSLDLHQPKFSIEIAKQCREIFFGGNWTSSSLKQNLLHVNWQQATQQVYKFNTIATLVYHMCYYVRAVTKVLEGRDLKAKDEHSFNHPPILNQQDWDTFLEGVWDDVEKFAQLIEQLPDTKLLASFTDMKYGNYYRNLQGIIQHAHYHLGQIVLIKKIISNDTIYNGEF